MGDVKTLLKQKLLNKKESFAIEHNKRNLIRLSSESCSSEMGSSTSDVTPDLKIIDIDKEYKNENVIDNELTKE